MKSVNPSRKVRQNAANDRKIKRDSISHKQQIENLDNKFGKGLGAVKERARLKVLIEETKKVSKKETQMEVVETPAVEIKAIKKSKLKE